MVLIFESEFGLILTVVDLIWFESDIVFDFDFVVDLILDEVWTLAPEEDPACWHKQLTKHQLQAISTKVPPNN